MDDHPTPITELRRILGLHHLYFQATDPATLLPLDGKTRTEIGDLLHRAGYLPDVPDPDAEAVAAAFSAFARRENLEDRLQADGRIDPVVLRYLRSYVQDRERPAPPARDEPSHLHLVRPGERPATDEAAPEG